MLCFIALLLYDNQHQLYNLIYFVPDLVGYISDIWNKFILIHIFIKTISRYPRADPGFQKGEHNLEILRVSNARKLANMRNTCENEIACNTALLSPPHTLALGRCVYLAAAISSSGCMWPAPVRSSASTPSNARPSTPSSGTCHLLPDPTLVSERYCARIRYRFSGVYLSYEVWELQVPVSQPWMPWLSFTEAW